jgi:hypothetical protein
MSVIPSLTILSEEQKFNGDNLLQWNTNIKQLLGAKGLLGYIDGRIPNPTSPANSEATTVLVTTSTPIYSTTPTPDEWTYRDQHMRGHLTLNCTDVASLGVITTGTAKEAWDSIQNEWGKSTDMRRSHAQETVNRTKYVEETEIQGHIKLLRTRKAALDNLSTQPMSDETWRGIIIRSIPTTPKWLPVIPSLYSMSSSADIISTLLAHGMILGRETITTNSSNIALAAHTNEGPGCKNVNCKAKDRSTHTTPNCYWPGGGKEGQFPVNFGQRPKANITSSESPSQQTEHFVLSARLMDTPGQSGILIDEPDVSSVGEQKLEPTPLNTPLDTASNEFKHNYATTNRTQLQVEDTEPNPVTTLPTDGNLSTNLVLTNSKPNIPDINDIDHIIIDDDDHINPGELSVNQPHITDNPVQEHIVRLQDSNSNCKCSFIYNKHHFAPCANLNVTDTTSITTREAPLAHITSISKSYHNRHITPTTDSETTNDDNHMIPHSNIEPTRQTDNSSNLTTKKASGAGNRNNLNLVNLNRDTDDHHGDMDLNVRNTPIITVITVERLGHQHQSTRAPSQGKLDSGRIWETPGETEDVGETEK